MPEALRPLLALGARWGDDDDIRRGRALDDASPADLRGLLAAVDPVRALLRGWLAGPESRRSPRLSREYVTLSNVMESSDSARTKLKRLARP